jgi:hypothetical protein
MGFLRFAKDNLAISVVTVLAAIVAVGSFVMDGVGVYQLGPPWWAWAAFSLAVFFASILLLLYRFEQRLPQQRRIEPQDPNWLEKLELVANQPFRNQEVRLDGKRFVGCEFHGVTLVYNGGPVSLENCTFGQHIITSESPEINRFAGVLMNLGHFKSKLYVDMRQTTLAELDSKNRSTRDTV